MNNPRFPHHCKITRIIADDCDTQFDDVAEEVLYEGDCRREVNRYDYRHYQQAAENAEYTVSLPVQFGLEIGDKAEVNFGVGKVKGIIIEWQPTNLKHLVKGVSYEIKEGITYDSERGMHISLRVDKA